MLGELTGVVTSAATRTIGGIELTADILSDGFVSLRNATSALRVQSDYFRKGIIIDAEEECAERIAARRTLRKKNKAVDAAEYDSAIADLRKL